ncbi:MAG: FMN-binding protein [Chitinispirillales bacterium]|jgi:Na+-translocating ferredoxin:NAD+ oxidoreductase RnfG subunit|nr:FMN-binding protein [Chitinispirillales bacterium]
MKNSVQIVFVLTLFVFAATFAIVFTYNKTFDKINKHTQIAQEFSLKSVLSQNSTVVADSVDGFGIYWKEFAPGNKIIGFAFIGAAYGYSSVINFFCGLDLDGKIKGLSIINQNETPGLGTRIVEVVSDAKFPFGLWKKQEKTYPWFCEQYKGVSTVDKISLHKNGEWHTLDNAAKDNLLKNNQITVITGSTITTTAITNEISARAKLLTSLVKITEEAEINTNQEHSEIKSED